MSREIKFRGMRDDISNPAFVYGDLVYRDGVPRITNDGGITFYTCIKGTVGQYTGLKDRNAKEIYEGDIVEGLFDGDFSVLHKAEIIFSTSAFVDNFYGYTLDCHRGNLNIIGNIHENANLLNS